MTRSIAARLLGEMGSSYNRGMRARRSWGLLLVLAGGLGCAGAASSGPTRLESPTSSEDDPTEVALEPVETEVAPLPPAEHPPPKPPAESDPDPDVAPLPAACEAYFDQIRACMKGMSSAARDPLAQALEELRRVWAGQDPTLLEDMCRQFTESLTATLPCPP
jgi:hypothetical protein